MLALYDSFNFSELQQMEAIPLQTILQTPVHELLARLRGDHWLQRRLLKFPASKFLVFDLHHQRLHLRVTSEYSLYDAGRITTIPACNNHENADNY